MSRDVLLVLLGAGIAAVAGIAISWVQHYLSLREDRIKRERDALDREAERLQAKRDKEEERRRAEREREEKEIKQNLMRGIEPSEQHIIATGMSSVEDIVQHSSIAGISHVNASEMSTVKEIRSSTDKVEQQEPED